MSNRDELHFFAEAHLMQAPLAVEFKLRQGVSGELMSFDLSNSLPSTLGVDQQVVARSCKGSAAD